MKIFFCFVLKTGQYNYFSVTESVLNNGDIPWEVLKRRGFESVRLGLNQDTLLKDRQRQLVSIQPITVICCIYFTLILKL